MWLRPPQLLWVPGRWLLAFRSPTTYAYVLAGLEWIGPREPSSPHGLISKGTSCKTAAPSPERLFCFPIVRDASRSNEEPEMLVFLVRSGDTIHENWTRERLRQPCYTAPTCAICDAYCTCDACDLNADLIRFFAPKFRCPPFPMQTPTLPPFNHTPAPYTGPSKEEVLGDGGRSS